MAESLQVAVFGAAGKMGCAIVRALSETPATVLAAAVERPDFPQLGTDASRWAGLPESGVRLRAERPAAGVADVWIDFSTPGVALANSKAAAQAGAAIVIGTTGLSAQDKEAIASVAKAIPIVVAPNMSVGVNVMLRLVADATRALGSAFDVEVVETHHRAKRDAPSGTALRLAEAVAEASGRDLGTSARYARQGDIGPRSAGEIGIQTVRGGDVVGDHTVFFLGQGERIEITHRASSRDILARGAVRAALWLRGRPAGLYDMRDVLGLR
jgi:4-hydroxy-tetrahydrodipicolinate reductase